MSVDWRRSLWALLSLALVCAMPSGQSLWLDEGYTVQYARDGDFSSLVARLLTDPGSEALRPLGMLSFWVGAKVFGHSELGLRLVSASWVAIAVLLLWRAGRLIDCAWLPTLLAVHPFVWHYAGEARPYAMLLAMGAGILYAFVAVWVGEATTDRGVAALLFFGLLASATDVLGCLLFGAVAAIVAWVLVKRGWRPRLEQLAALAISAGALVLLGVYYAWTLARGVETGWEGVWRVGVGNLLFAAYEHLGFAGFGPGRNELRQAVLAGELGGVMRTFARPSAIGLPILAALELSLLLRLAKRLRTDPPGAHSLVAAAGAVIALTAAATFAVSAAVRFSFWGRHLAAICPFVVLVAVLAARGPREQTRSSPGAPTLCLAIAWLASSLLLRFDGIHRRDDYRSAASIALAAAESGETVWWLASRHCGEYYGLRFCDRLPVPEDRCVVRMESPGAGGLYGVPDPDLIVISRPEFYDHQGVVQSYLTTHGYTVVARPAAFLVWRQAG